MQHARHDVHCVNDYTNETGSYSNTERKLEGFSGHDDKSVKAVNLSSRYCRSRRPSRSFFASSRLRRVTARFDSRYLQQVYTYMQHWHIHTCNLPAIALYLTATGVYFWIIFTNKYQATSSLGSSAQPCDLI